MKKLLYVLLFGTLMFSCTETEKPNNPDTPGVISFKANANILYGEWQGWVILQSLDGGVLEMKEIIKDTEVQFENLEDPTYHLTYFTKVVSPLGDENYIGNTFLEVPVGKTYFLGLGGVNPQFKYGEGNFGISVMHNSEIAGAFSSSGDGIPSFNSNLSDGQLDLSQGFSKNTDKYMVVAYDYQGNFRYKYLSNATVDQRYSVNYSEMKAFDQEVTIPVSFSPNMMFEVIALTEDDSQFYYGNILASTRFGILPELNNYRIGFLNEFKKYEVKILYNSNAGSVYYRKVGTAPTKIEIPENLTISSSSRLLSNFQAQLPSWSTSFSASVNKNIINENGNKFFNYQVNGDSGNFALKFPEELENKIPFLENSEAMEFSIIQAGKSTLDYQETIKNVFFELPVKLEIESISISKTFN